MEVRIADCPLGAKCEEAKLVEGRQVLFRCPWYVKLEGKNPQNQDPVDHWNCAIAWLPILTIENTKEAIGVSASIDRFHNEMARGRQAVLQAVSNSTPAGLVPDHGEIREIKDARDDRS